jgi:starch phosphorylase
VQGETFSMGVLALRNSDGRNAVSELHGHVSRKMWNFLWADKNEEEVPITHITNGVHVSNWMARRLSNLFKEYIADDWYDHLDETDIWKRVDDIPDRELWAVRLHLKRKLAFYMDERVRERWRAGGFHPVQVVSSGVMINPYALTIGFARRFATYKRAGLVLTDFERLLNIINRPNMPVQILFAGKAHPADEPGKLLIQQVYLVQGVDVWMNTPRRPLEASGTSGMKAALNGALNFSVLDGWWREAYNGRNGWSIGQDRDLGSPAVQDEEDVESLYETLEKSIIPLYYDRDQNDMSREWVARIKESLKTNIPQFSTRRMVKEYVERLYLKALK